MSTQPPEAVKLVYYTLFIKNNQVLTDGDVGGEAGGRPASPWVNRTFAGLDLLPGSAGGLKFSLGYPVAMVHTQSTRLFLGQGIAVALAVSRPHEGRHCIQRPVRDTAGLPPEVRQAEIDVELKQFDT